MSAQPVEWDPASPTPLRLVADALPYEESDAREGMDWLFPSELDWMERALCAQTDPDCWYPERGSSTRDAKRVCMSCPVRVDCLEHALANREEWGIWGGLSETERRALPAHGGR